MITFPAKKKAHCPICGAFARIMDRTAVTVTHEGGSLATEMATLDCGVCGKFQIRKVPKI